MNKKQLASKDIEKQFNIIRTFISICIALIIAFVLVTIVSDQPIEALKEFLFGPIASKRNLGNVVELMIPLTFAGLSVCIMFQAKQINMGAEGAFFLGGLGAAYVAINFILPSGIHPTIAILFGGFIGGIVCVIPGLLKVKWGANEVVSSLMLNYVMLFLGSYILQYFMLDAKAGYPASNLFIETSKLKPMLSGTRVHFGIILALIFVFIIYTLIYKSKIGYSIRILGKNEKFALYSGINVGTTIILAQFFGGIIAGIGGAIEVLGLYTRFSWVSLPGFGFDGIIIAILSKNNPKFVPLSAFFLAYLRIGADIMARRTDVAPEVVSVIQSIIILLIAAKMFLEKYKHKKIVENSKRKELSEVM